MAKQLSKQIKSPDVSIASKQIADMARLSSENRILLMIFDMADKIRNNI